MSNNEPDDSKVQLPESDTLNRFSRFLKNIVDEMSYPQAIERFISQKSEDLHENRSEKLKDQ